MTINGDHPTLADAQNLLPNVVFLAVDVSDGEHKKPVRKRYQKLTLADTLKPGYQRHLALANTVGVLLGPPSNRIAVIDCDSDPFLESMLTDNSALLTPTLRSHGRRGAAFWFWHTELTPEGIHVLTVDRNSPLAAGGKPDEKTGRVKIGELRCSRGFQVICGLHPCQKYYDWPVAEPPVELQFSEIRWPTDVTLPWIRPGVVGGGDNTAHDTELLRKSTDRLSISYLWDYFHYPERTGNPTNSPFRDDETPSFSIYDNDRKWKDHGNNDGGDSFDFYQRATGQTASDAFKDFVTLAGLGDQLRVNKKSAAAGSGNDSRPLIQHVGTDRYVTEFATDLGEILKVHDFYRFRGRAVYVGDVTEKSRSGKEYQTKKLIEVPPILFAGLIEKYCRPVRGGDFKSIPVEIAARTLPLPHFLNQLPVITLFSEIRTPCPPYIPQGRIRLSDPGYDPHTGIYTAAEAPEVDENLSVEAAAEAWRSLLKEFCFREEDRKRSISVALAAALTPTCATLLSEEGLRPAFLASANAEGAGKTLLLSIGMVARLGYTPAGSAPSTEEEKRKVINAAVHYAVPILFFDNLKGHLNSESIDSFLTSTMWPYRILGSTNWFEARNVSTVYLTSNFATYDGSIRRRSLAVELILKEAKAEDRIIENYLNEARLIVLRPKLLSIFWAMIKDWDNKGQPSGSILLPKFEEWSRVVSGIVENAGFISPCTPSNLVTGGDTYMRDMETLVSEMVVGTEYKFGELVDLAYDHHLFPSLIPESGSLPPAERSKLGKLIRRYAATPRTFNTRYVFRITGETRSLERYSIIDLQNT